MLSVDRKNIFIPGDMKETKGSSVPLSELHVFQNYALVYFDRKPFGIALVDTCNYSAKKTLILSEEVWCNFCLLLWWENPLNPCLQFLPLVYLISQFTLLGKFGKDQEQ